MKQTTTSHPLSRQSSIKQYALYSSNPDQNSLSQIKAGNVTIGNGIVRSEFASP